MNSRKPSFGIIVKIYSKKTNLYQKAIESITTSKNLSQKKFRLISNYIECLNHNI